MIGACRMIDRLGNIRRYECPLHGEVNHVVGMGGDRKPLHWECGEACEVVEYVPTSQLRGAVGERDEALRLLANATDPENRGDWDEAREIGWAFARKFDHMWGQ